MTITIISVGTKPSREMDALIQDYVKRMPKHITVTWRFISHGVGDPKRSVAQESEAIMRILTDQKIILLDETGKDLTSPQLSEFLYDNASNCTFIIGGAYGVSEHIKERAHLVLSFGKLVYPHQLMRLILAEQIYRTYTIHKGHPYHHE